jgi:hypothetical protein
MHRRVGGLGELGRLGQHVVDRVGRLVGRHRAQVLRPRRNGRGTARVSPTIDAEHEPGAAAAQCWDRR